MFEEGKTKGNVKRSAESVQKPKTPPPGQGGLGANADEQVNRRYLIEMVRIN